MSLLSNGSTQKTNCGSGSSTANLGIGTAKFWIYPTVISANDFGRVWQRGLFASGFHYVIINDSVAGDIGMTYHRSTLVQQVNTNANELVLNTWNFVAVTWDAVNTVDTDQKVYVGNLTTPAAEVGSYAVQQSGSGSHTSNAGTDFIIGNKSNNNAPTNARIANLRMWNRILTAGEILTQQKNRGPIGIGSALNMELGWNGTGTQPDWSGNGNNGTVSGMTVADHVPLGPRFGFDDFSPSFLAGSGLSIPVGMHHYTKNIGANR
jgi:hypothetical protein